MNRIVKTAMNHWRYTQPLTVEPTTINEYKNLAKSLGGLLDICADNPTHPVWGLVNIISDHLARYDAQNISIPKSNPIDCLKYLMKEHGLTQKDLSDIGSQGVVSEIVNGKRLLNARQIKCLADRFNVSSDIFIG